MSTAVLDRSIQRVRKLDPDLILGHLAWFSIHEQRTNKRNIVVDRSDIVDGLKNAGLTGVVPPAPAGHHIFRRVTSDAQRKKISTATPGIFQNILLRDVSGGGESTIVRRLVVETVDSKGKELSYHQLVDVVYHRESGRITHRYREDYAENIMLADRTVLLIRAEFHDQHDKLTSWTIREFVRKLLYERGATCVRTGGAVFFLRQEFADDLDAIETFVKDLPSGLGEFHSLPLIDDLKQRQMLQKAFEDETTGAIYERLAEIDEIRKAGKKVTSDKKAKMLVEMNDLKKKTREYSNLLETQLETADSAVTIFEAKMRHLLNQEEEE